MATAIKSSNKHIDIKNSKLFPLFKRHKKQTTSRHEQPIDQRWSASSEKMSSLTVRILSVNIIAIMILAAGILYLGEYTDSLIDNELKSLESEARFVSGALSEGAVRPVFQISPIPFEDPLEIEAVKPQLARNMLGRLGQSTKTHIRLFSVDNSLIGDTRTLSVSSAHVQREVLSKKDKAFNIGYLFNQSAGRFLDVLPTQTKFNIFPTQNFNDIYQFHDAQRAMLGQVSTSAWRRDDDTLILTAAAPIQKIKQVLGVVVLERDGRELEEKILQIRVDVFRVFLGSLGITVMLSIYLSGLIGKPLKKLALAAEAVRLGKGRDLEIPDMSKRGDEIGELSLVLRDMTQALRDRMDTIERFAADVSHEIKNPLTSLRSAVETAAKIKDETKRQKLMDIIHHDVQRLDRLISDISNASRLDAELTREEMSRVDLVQLILQLKDAYKKPIDRIGEDGKKSKDRIIAHIPENEEFVILGNEERLGQVFGNLMSNALSFSSGDDIVEIKIGRAGKNIIITVEDEGPGIPDNKIEAIFERFYTERPDHEDYGVHSGLGLSISKQIIDAHDGEIWAENKKDTNGKTSGAIFKVKLESV